MPISKRLRGLLSKFPRGNSIRTALNKRKRLIAEIMLVFLLAFLIIFPFESKVFLFGGINGEIHEFNPGTHIDFMNLSSYDGGEDFISKTQITIWVGEPAYIAGLYVLMPSHNTTLLLQYFEDLRIDIGGTSFTVVDNQTASIEYSGLAADNGYWYRAGISTTPELFPGETTLDIWAYGTLGAIPGVFTITFAVEVETL